MIKLPDEAQSTHVPYDALPVARAADDQVVSRGGGHARDGLRVAVQALAERQLLLVVAQLPDVDNLRYAIK